jgi:iron-sulfur cluster insertion protein
MTDADTLPGITVTESAAARIREILSKGAAGEFVRLAVNAGGCSGFSYDFKVDATREPDDRLFGAEGAGLVVDPASLELLAGCEVEFVETLAGSHFAVKNPNAISGCGCGTSFAI